MKKLTTIKIDLIWALFFGILSFFFLFLHFKFYPVYQFGLNEGNNFSKNLKLILPSFCFLILFFTSFFYSQKTKLTFFKIFIAFVFSLSFGMFFFAISINESSLFEKVSFAGVFFRILRTLSFFSIGSLFFTVLLASFGNRLLGFFNHSKKLNLEKEVLPSFFLGFGVLSFLGFFLAKLHLFTLEILFFVLLFFLFWGRLKLISFLKKIVTIRFGITTSELLLGSIFFSVIVLNFSQSFYPFSVGWDSANQYLLTAKILINENVLRTGIFPPFIEIVLAVWGKFTGISGIQFLLNFWGSFLPISLFIFIRKLKVPRKLNIWLTLAFFLLPALQFQLSKDLKLDLIFFQLILSSILLLKEKQTSLACLFLGFSVLCKLTAFWFFPFLLIILLFDIVGSKKEFFAKGKELIYNLFFLFLPLVILSLTNISEVRRFPQSKEEIIEVFLKGKNNNPSLKIKSFPTLEQKNSKINSPAPSTSYREEVGRYSGFKNNFFEKVFAVFSSPQIPLKNKQYVNIGFLWISCVIFFLLNYLFFWKKIKKEDWCLTGLVFSFAFFWIVMGEGIAWYCFPFLGLFLPLFMKQLVVLKLKKTQKLFVVFLFISCFLGIYSRLLHTPKMNFLTAISWATFPTETNQSRLETLFLKEEKTVSEILNKNIDAKVLRVGTLARFFIKNGEVRIFEDSQLDLFQKISGNNFKETLFHLHQNDIQYLLIDRGAASIEINKEGSLHKKLEKLNIFVNEALSHRKIKSLFQGNRIILLEILKSE